MQIIISLLKLQDYKTEDPVVHEIIRDCRSRIYSMAVIHEKLYQTHELSSIRLEEYIRDIAGRVIHEFETESSRVCFTIEENTPVLVDIGTGIPLGLIINELLTNSMKYAFMPGEDGNIAISIFHTGNHLTLSVSDSGRGLPEKFNSDTADTLGTELIRSLAFQLGGTAAWTKGPGTTCTITVPHHLTIELDKS
jgi:two-component sensor histidine kinase